VTADDDATETRDVEPCVALEDGVEALADLAQRGLERDPGLVSPCAVRTEVSDYGSRAVHGDGPGKLDDLDVVEVAAKGDFAEYA
jgi:hypothetical protein